MIFGPMCYVYKDKYVIKNKQGEDSEIYYLPNGIRAQFF